MDSIYIILDTIGYKLIYKYFSHYHFHFKSLTAWSTDVVDEVLTTFVILPPWTGPDTLCNVYFSLNLLFDSSYLSALTWVIVRGAVCLKYWNLKLFPFCYPAVSVASFKLETFYLKKASAAFWGSDRLVVLITIIS